MSQPFDGQGGGRRDSPVTAQILEERINVYISAMDRALSMNDTSMSAQLQRDIQQLVDLMEKVQSGQVITEKDVPPPLVMTPLNDVLANPLGELSSRLSDYHKALYFAEEELSEGRINKIQALQKGLQTIHTLQKRAQAGFPIREDEVPPPVTIPSDSEFDNNAVKTITERIEQYNAVLKTCKESSGADRRRIPKIESGIRTLEFLITRAKANRPVWRKDIPPEFEYYAVNPDSAKMNKAKMTIQLQSLITRTSKVKCERPEQQNVVEELNQKLKSLVQSLSSSSSPQKVDIQSLVHQVEALEMMKDHETEMDEAGVKDVKLTQRQKDDLALIESRIKEYSTAAVRAKKEGQVKSAIEHLKVVKGLNPMKETLEKGSNVDMTLVPPPPKDKVDAESPSSLSSSPEPEGHAGTVAHAQVTEVTGGPTSAHAQVTDVNTKPVAAESSKSKLARRLAHYLEVDTDVVSPDSTSSSSFDSDSVSSPQEETSDHKPVVAESHVSSQLDAPQQNRPDSESKTTNEPVPQKLSLSNIGFVSCENRSGTEGMSAMVNPEQKSAVSDSEKMSSTTLKSHESLNSSPARVLRGSIGSVLDTKGAEDQSLIKPAVSGDKKQAVVNREPEMQTTSNVFPKPKEESVSKKESNSSGHLDSIGFLSCQDVPSFPPESSSDQSSSRSSENTPYDLQSFSKEHQNMSPSSELSDLRTDFPAINKLVGGSLGEIVEKEECKSNTAMESESVHNAVGLQDEQFTNTVHSESSNPITNNTIGESLLTGQSHTLAGDSNCNQITQSMINESNKTQSTLPSHEKDTNMDVSRHIKAQEVNNLHSKMTASNNSSAFHPSSEPVSTQNQNPNVNGFLSNSSKDCSSHDNAGKIDTTDAEEFADLMNSMSFPQPSGEGTLQSIKNNEGYVVNNEQMYKEKESDGGILKNKPYTSLPYESNTFEKNEKSNVDPIVPSEPVFHSFPANLSNSMSAQDSYSSLPNTNSTSVLSMSSALHASSSAVDTPSSLTPSLPHLPLGSLIKGTDSLTETSKGLTSASSVNSNSSPFTCLETLKYDILLAEAKNSTESKHEAEQLGRDLAAIKDKLRKGKRKIWEEYKNRVEYELQVLNIGVKRCQETQNWDEYKYLNSKRMLNERELTLLNRRVHEIQE